MSFEALKRFKVEDDIKEIRDAIVQIGEDNLYLIKEVKALWMALNKSQEQQLEINQTLIDMLNR